MLEFDARKNVPLCSRYARLLYGANTDLHTDNTKHTPNVLVLYHADAATCLWWGAMSVLAHHTRHHAAMYFKMSIPMECISSHPELNTG
eukprot:COSAG02_NODE_4950_length_4796_cov_7.041729_2_plen_89_part_00